MSYCVCVCGQYFWFEAKLWCDCPFWLDDLRDSCVCECLESEFPESFQKPFNHDFSSKDLINQEGKPQAVVNHTLDAKAFKGWVEVNNPWTNDDETDNGTSRFQSTCATSSEGLYGGIGLALQQ
eukprot:XP_019075837.1 PREDICTED: endoplasmic reticulum oxidoreductin-1 isoform X3 [Vitis vinifera]